MSDDLAELQQRLRRFAEERDWGHFHTPRNLVLAIAGEVGELAAEVQWLTDKEVTDALQDVERRQPLVDEMADILIYLIRLADVSGVHLLEAAQNKIARNEDRYPPDLARGNAGKYTSFDREA